MAHKLKLNKLGGNQYLFLAAVTISAFPLKLSLLAEDGLFEGDLKITDSLVQTTT